MATGVPKPDTPSSNAPKQKPITTSTTRRSLGRWSITQTRKASNRPDVTAMLYSSSALTTIHITGHTANTAPLTTAFTASPTGICHAVTETIRAMISPIRAACHAGRRKTPSSTSTATTGSTATRNESDSEPPTGVRSC